ncbi:MAG: class I SAM-dependent rRNA methyltransferase [Deltaproteobacteria bacterium]|nr:class I SAM-dependent rRNA methyltransferase [Deltaproteobacteria bacterium]
MARVVLQKKLDRVIAEGHPWIFRDALSGELPEPGKIVTVVDSRSRFVARGLAEAGPIGVRVLCTRDEPVSAGLFARRIAAASALRERVLPPETTAYRLLHGEGDRLPGVVCDVYAGWAVLQLDGQAAARWRDVIVETLAPVLRARGAEHLIDRSGRRGERRVEVLCGELPPEPVPVLECGLRMRADLRQGQKTGLFLDHRDSRRKVRALARGARVLDLYGYTGGFSISAGLGGAVEVVTVDRSKWACALAEQGWAENGLGPGVHRCEAVDVRDFLDADPKGEYDLLVVDPPSFAPSEKKVKAALDAYRALHRAALSRLRPGGLYLAASCSSHVRRKAFERTVLQAAGQDGRALQVLDRWGAPADHPRLAAFPEGDYLTVLLARLID